MNWYQRQKAKRMKKLSSLGVSYSCQKYIMRKYNFTQIDRMIEQLNTMQKAGVLKKIAKSFANVIEALIAAFKCSKKEDEILKNPERINLRM